MIHLVLHQFHFFQAPCLITGLYTFFKMKYVIKNSYFFVCFLNCHDLLTFLYWTHVNRMFITQNHLINVPTKFARLLNCSVFCMTFEINLD
jgi:hypothetical protein